MLKSILIVAGESSCVLDLADGRLDGQVKQRVSAGTKIDDETLSKNVIIVEIQHQANDDDSASFAVEQWLKKHSTILNECEADKTLEFQTDLQPEDGSRILTLPSTLIQIAADLRLSLANQAIKVLTDDEYIAMRRSNNR